ncbi:hypothetical protein [uncultured Roseibium sp.]|nr:hypothetical protein [uncultured Roseibium sp.]
MTEVLDPPEFVPLALIGFVLSTPENLSNAHATRSDPEIIDIV